MAKEFRAVNDIGGVKIHPAANMFPMMNDDEFKVLFEDIKERGLEQPIEVDTDGRITDGRNRWKAMHKLGTTWDELVKGKMVKTRKKPDRELTAEVWSANFARRHLTSEQKAAAIILHQEQIGQLDKYEAEAKADAERARAERKAAGVTKETKSRGATAERLAKDAGVTPATAEKVVEKHRKGGKKALEDIVNGSGEERRGKGERVKSRMPNNPEGLAEFLLSNWTTKQVKQLIKLLSAETPSAQA